MYYLLYGVFLNLCNYSFPFKKNGNLLQYSYLKNPMDREA